MFNIFTDSWSWWFSGLMIGLTVPLVALTTGKAFGISSSLKHFASLCTPQIKFDYISKNNWRAGAWKLLFALGIILGAYVTSSWILPSQPEFLPKTYASTSGIIRLFIGGIFVGFGTRYAGGCTSGHAITGLSNLDKTSLIATIFFFVGGLIATYLFGNLIF